MTEHKVVSRKEWAGAREQLLVREKEHTRLGDELARQRRELPWVAIKKEYRFETDEGTRTLVELFDGRSQLRLSGFSEKFERRSSRPVRCRRQRFGRVKSIRRRHPGTLISRLNSPAYTYPCQRFTDALTNASA